MSLQTDNYEGNTIPASPLRPANIYCQILFPVLKIFFFSVKKIFLLPVSYGLTKAIFPAILPTTQTHSM